MVFHMVPLENVKWVHGVASERTKNYATNALEGFPSTPSFLSLVATSLEQYWASGAHAEK
jgi:hypothetical protein